MYLQAMNIDQLLVASIMLCHVTITYGQSTCPVPPSYPHSDVEWSDRTLGAYATYSCDKGYEMTSTPNRVIAYCDEDQEWRASVEPECRAILCAPPAIPAFGNYTLVSGSGEYGSIILYSCDESYDLIGDRVVLCLANGMWSSVPVCQIQCRAAITPNGLVERLSDHVCLDFGSADDDRLDWWEAQAQCQTQQGSLVAILDEESQEEIVRLLSEVIDVRGMDRFWIGAEERQIAAAQSTRSWQWVDGSVVDYTSWGPDEPSLAADSTSIGECVDLDPITSYSWSDNNCSAWQRRICQFGDNRVCGDPGVPLHGIRTLRTCDNDYGVAFFQGCLVTYECDPGYEMDGSSTSTCETNGLWSQPLPTCEPKRCPVPPPEEYLERGMARAYRRVAVYRCPNGSYPVEGDVFLTCQENGAWAGARLQCSDVILSTTILPGEATLEPRTIDWTFIGIVGALGIFLLLAIFVIVILACVRNSRLNSDRTHRRPLPSTTGAAGRKRRSEDTTYYSIRYPNLGGSGNIVDLSKKKMDDIGENVKLSGFAQHNATYEEETTNKAANDDDYLIPIKPGEGDIDSGNAAERCMSGAYDTPMSPRSGTYDQVDDGDNLSEDGLLNNYIILLPDDDEEGEGGKSDGVVAMSQLTEVKIEETEVTKVEGQAETETETVKDSGVLQDAVQKAESEQVDLPKNGLEVPGINLNYSKEKFGSTVEL